MADYLSLNLNYHQNLLNTYKNFCSLPGFVLLQSSDIVKGRYDILSAHPYDRLIIDNIEENISSILDRLQPSDATEQSNIDIPFQGGAIGYISYDFGAKLSGIDSLPQNTLSDMPLLDMGLYDWAIIVDHHQKEVILFSANTQASTASIIKEMANLWQTPSIERLEFKVTSPFHSLIEKEQYKQSFSSIRNDLIQGRAYQVNYTQAFHAGFSGDTWEIYRQIIASNPVPYSAFMRIKQADILSFSPERFILYDKGNLLTSPIKGTIARSPHILRDKQLKNQLYSCEKNRAENVMIVDLMRNDLGRVAMPGSVRVSNLCAIQSYNSVHHLVSDIKATCLPHVQPFEAFLSCFPGGSITGAPKLESMKIIHEQEPYARGIYCGSIGYFSNHGRFDTNIAIRTITAKNNILHLAAGGGIVIDSECEDEYRECFTKITAIINGLK